MNNKSPLLFPVFFEKDSIFVLDETALPFKKEFIVVRSLKRALEVLKQMKTRSLGQVLLFFYSCALFGEDKTSYDVADMFSEARPTFDFQFIAGMIEGQKKQGLTGFDVADFFVSHFDKGRRARARALAGLLPEKAKIATICNVNGELIYLYEELIRLGKTAEFVVTETRPYLQGTRLTFWELARNDIPVKLCCDNQIAVVMRDGGVNCVVVGADRATTSGDIVNKIGTYALAKIAKRFDIPFYALTQYPRDIDVDSITIEFRQGEEVFMYLDDVARDVKGLYPAFDVVRGEDITKCIDLNNPEKKNCYE